MDWWKSRGGKSQRREEFCVAGARFFCTLSKVSRMWEFVAVSKKMAGVGHLKRKCKDAFSVAGAVQETCSSEMLYRKSWRWFPVAFWSIRSSDLGRWFCVTGAALRMTWHHFFVAGAIFWRHGLEKSQNALARGRQLRKSRRIAWYLMLKLKKSRRIAAFSMLSSFETVRKSCRIASFSSLQIDR